MAEIEFSSLNDELRCLVHREFERYIPVPSLADSSEFNILYFCSPISTNEPENQSWTSTIKKKFSWSDQKQAESENFVSLGWLFDHCEEDPGDKEKKRENQVCIHGQVSGSKVISADMKGELLPIAGCSGSSSFENMKVLELGKIVKQSIPFGEINYLLKRITAENSPALFRESKKRHVYVIYEVLLAEHLKIKEHESANIEGNVSATVQNHINAKGSSSWKRSKDCHLSRPKSMGRYPFAYKCGRVRVKKRKRHLELVGLKEFYEPFKIKRQNESNTSDQSQSPPEYE